MTTPAIRCIRRNFPRADIRLAAKPWVAQVFTHNPYLDQIIIYDSGGRHKGPLGKAAFIREIAEMGFDTAVLFQNAFEAAFLAFLGNIPQRIGFDTDGRRFLLTRPVPLTNSIKKMHHTRYYLEILKGAGIKTGSTELDMFIAPEEKVRAEEILADFRIPRGVRLIGVNPGAAYGSAKRWFPDRYADLINRLLADESIYVLIFGSSGEKDLGEWICGQAGKRCVNLCGGTNLREAISLIDRCSGFITNDSGLMHISSALNIPLIAIFGPTDHITTSPLSRSAKIVRSRTECSPCLKRECPLDHSCMEGVTVDMVFAEARKRFFSDRRSVQDVS